MQTYRAEVDGGASRKKKRKREFFGVAFLVLFAIGVLTYWQGKNYLFEGLPNLPDKAAMWDLNKKDNSTILDMNGLEIGHRGPYLGRPLKLSEMPAFLPQAFLAIEDERFYKHTGIDRKAIFRAFFENTKAGRTVQGGSTLTQQLVKNMLLTPDQNYRRKFQEMWLAYEMEKRLSKPEILELYLNRIDLGNRAFGVEAAAQRYFGKSATSISLAEAAMLAALPKAPSRYNLVENYAGAHERSKLVLRRMLSNNFITVLELNEAETNKPVIAAQGESPIDPAYIGHAYDRITERANELIGHKHKDLIIKTTLNPALQKSAHIALTKTLDIHGKKKKIQNGALVSIDTQTGAIRALIGGRDYNSSKFNRAIQAKRQPGSSFKAFVYAAALEHGFTPGTVRIDEPTEIGEWAPENYTRRYRGPMTMREAFKLSINTIAAQVGAEVGPSNIAELARRFGITTNMRPTYSIALGSSETTLLDMTAAYMVFANEGKRRPPYLIESIIDTSGTQLYKRRKRAPEQVYAIPYARQMNGMLRDVIDSGTGHGAQLGTRQAAGKTGTSQDYRDAWFIGFTAHYTTGVWMGNDDNTPTKKITGGLLPVDVWKAYMRAAHKNKKRRPINAPDPLIKDDRTRNLIVFYERLTADFMNERDIANGRKTVQN